MTKQVALYARVSSEQQATAGTIRSQIESLVERIQSEQMSCPDEFRFVDDGYSGATLVRPALERLRDTVYSGAIDRLYVHSPDRLSRKYAYQILLIDEFRRAGVEVVFLNRQVGDSPEDELLLQVQGIVSEYERAKIMERSRRGKIHAARRGSVNVLGGAPFGYRYVSKKETDGDAHYEIVFEEARVVQQIFEWVGKERVATAEVARRLEAAGVKTRTGKSWWDRTTIWGMLKNPAYAGQAAFGKTKAGPMRARLRPQKGHEEQPRDAHSTYDVPAEDWIKIPVPGLVTPALFEVVQEQLEQNRTRQRERRRGAAYLLQGLLACKLCGHAFYGKPISPSGRKGNPRHYAYYRCIGMDGYRFGGTRICDNKQVRTDLVEDAVWAEVMRLLKNPDCLEKEYKRRLSAGKHTDATQLENEQTKLRNAIERMIDGYSDGLIEKKEFEPRVKRTRAKLNQIESQLKKVAQDAASDRQLRLLIVQFGDFSSQLKSKLDELDWHTKREVIRAIVKQVEIDHDSVNVTFRIGQFAIPKTEAG